MITEAFDRKSRLSNYELQHSKLGVRNEIERLDWESLSADMQIQMHRLAEDGGSQQK